MNHRWLPALALLAPLLMAPSSAVALTLEANPTTSTVTVTGGTANASIALVGVTHDLVPFGHARAEIAEVIADTNGDGAVSFSRSVPLNSVWAAVDLTNGALALAAPLGGELRELVKSGTDVTVNTSGVPQVTDPREALALFLIRPNSGSAPPIYLSTLRDGTARDADNNLDGTLMVSLDELSAPTSGDHPATFGVDDVLIGIDPWSLEIFHLTLESLGSLKTVLPARGVR